MDSQINAISTSYLLSYRRNFKNLRPWQQRPIYKIIVLFCMQMTVAWSFTTWRSYPQTNTATSATTTYPKNQTQLTTSSKLVWSNYSNFMDHMTMPLIKPHMKEFNKKANIKRRRQSCVTVYDVLTGKNELRCSEMPFKVSNTSSSVLHNQQLIPELIAAQLINGSFKFHPNQNFRSVESPRSSTSFPNSPTLLKKIAAPVNLSLNRSLSEMSGQAHWPRPIATPNSPVNTDDNTDGIEIVRYVRLFPSNDNAWYREAILQNNISNLTHLQSSNLTHLNLVTSSKSNNQSTLYSSVTIGQPNPIIPFIIPAIPLNRRKTTLLQQSFTVSPHLTQLTQSRLDPNVYLTNIPILSSTIIDFDTEVSQNINISQTYTSFLPFVSVTSPYMKEINPESVHLTTLIMPVQANEVLMAQPVLTNSLIPRRRSNEAELRSNSIRTVGARLLTDELTPVDTLISRSSQELTKLYRTAQARRMLSSGNDNQPPEQQDSSAAVVLNRQLRQSINGQGMRQPQGPVVNVSNVYVDQSGWGQQDTTIFDYTVHNGQDGSLIPLSEVLNTLRPPYTSDVEASKILNRNIIQLAAPTQSPNNPLNVGVSDQRFRAFGKNQFGITYTKKEKGRIAGIIIGIMLAALFLAFLCLFAVANIIELWRTRRRNNLTNTPRSTSTRAQLPILTVTRPSAALLRDNSPLQNVRQSQILKATKTPTSTAPLNPISHRGTTFPQPGPSLFQMPADYIVEDPRAIPYPLRSPPEIVDDRIMREQKFRRESDKSEKYRKVSVPKQSAIYKKNGLVAVGSLTGKKSKSQELLERYENSSHVTLKDTCEDLRHDMYTIIDKAVASLFSFVDTRERRLSSFGNNRVRPSELEMKDLRDNLETLRESVKSLKEPKSWDTSLSKISATKFGEGQAPFQVDTRDLPPLLQTRPFEDPSYYDDTGNHMVNMNVGTLQMNSSSMSSEDIMGIAKPKNVQIALGQSGIAAKTITHPNESNLESHQDRAMHGGEALRNASFDQISTGDIFSLIDHKIEGAISSNDINLQNPSIDLDQKNENTLGPIRSPKIEATSRFRDDLPVLTPFKILPSEGEEDKCDLENLRHGNIRSQTSNKPSLRKQPSFASSLSSISSSSVSKDSEKFASRSLQMIDTRPTDESNNHILIGSTNDEDRKLKSDTFTVAHHVANHSSEPGNAEPILYNQDDRLTQAEKFDRRKISIFSRSDSTYPDDVIENKLTSYLGGKDVKNENNESLFKTDIAAAYASQSPSESSINLSIESLSKEPKLFGMEYKMDVTRNADLTIDDANRFDRFNEPKLSFSPHRFFDQRRKGSNTPEASDPNQIIANPERISGQNDNGNNKVNNFKTKSKKSLLSLLSSSVSSLDIHKDEFNNLINNNGASSSNVTVSNNDRFENIGSNAPRLSQDSIALMSAQKATDGSKVQNISIINNSPNKSRLTSSSEKRFGMLQKQPPLTNDTYTTIKNAKSSRRFSMSSKNGLEVYRRQLDTSTRVNPVVVTNSNNLLNQNKKNSVGSVPHLNKSQKAAHILVPIKPNRKRASLIGQQSPVKLKSSKLNDNAPHPTRLNKSLIEFKDQNISITNDIGLMSKMDLAKSKNFRPPHSQSNHRMNLKSEPFLNRNNNNSNYNDSSKCKHSNSKPSPDKKTHEILTKIRGIRIPYQNNYHNYLWGSSSTSQYTKTNNTSLSPRSRFVKANLSSIFESIENDLKN